MSNLHIGVYLYYEMSRVENACECSYINIRLYVCISLRV